MSSAYDAMNGVWKKTCRMLLGDEIGELDEFDKWLSEFVAPVNGMKSGETGEDVYFAVPHYSKDSKFISLDEVDFSKRFEPLDVNDIKDIDSIAGALKERFSFCGNIVLGKSTNIEKSSNIQDSHNIYKSAYLYECKCVAYSSYIKNCKNVFTTNSDCGSEFLIRCLEGFNGHRSFETWSCYNCSDCYFSFGVRSSQDVMFSFNVDKKKYVIGNMQLSKENYSRIKNGLLSQIRDELEKKKYLPSVIDMASGKKPEMESAMYDENENTDIDKIERSFQKTTGTILGKSLYGIKDYGDWLNKNIPLVHERKSAISGAKLFKSGNYPLSVLPDDKLVKEDEARKIAESMRLDIADLESFDKIKASLWKIALFTPEFRVGDNRNVIETPLSNSSNNCLRGCVYNDSKDCAYCFWPRDSEYMFGSQMTVNSSHGIKCHNSTKISRCFETDSCSSCSEMYFSHNCENVHDSMFCFNVKNMRHGIGNAVYDPQKYKKVKDSILEQVMNELEEKKELKWSIFNIGC